MSYEPLTKTATDDNGNQVVVCRLHGTNECQIHTSRGCSDCPVFAAILLQLNTFETIYIKEDER